MTRELLFFSKAKVIFHVRDDYSLPFCYRLSFAPPPCHPTSTAVLDVGRSSRIDVRRAEKVELSLLLGEGLCLITQNEFLVPSS